MIIWSILLRKLDSVQYFAQFDRYLYEWQCLLTQNRSQHYWDNRKQVRVNIFLLQVLKSMKVRHDRKLCSVLWISQAMNLESSRTMKDIWPQLTQKMAENAGLFLPIKIDKWFSHVFWMSAGTGGSADTVVWRVSSQNENMIPNGHILLSKLSTGYETFILMADGDQSDYRHGNHADRQRNMAFN